MKALPLERRDEFKNHWVFTKTKQTFSSMLLDQAHEQNNKTVKGAGAAVCLTEYPDALKRWMVADPEQARILSEFEGMYCTLDQHTLNHARRHASQETIKTGYQHVRSDRDNGKSVHGFIQRINDLGQQRVHELHGGVTTGSNGTSGKRAVFKIRQRCAY